MAAALKAKLTGGSTSSDADLKEEQEKYRLLVTAGPSYNEKSHKIVRVNSEVSTVVENEFLTARINVRVLDFRGLPDPSPSTSEYFADPMHAKDRYSVGFSFVPKKDIRSVDTVWGNDLDHPVRDKLPPGFNTAFKIVKEFIDPGLSCDVYADEPWLYGPSLSCWFGFRIGEMVKEGDDFPAPGVMADGADGTGKEVREKLGLPENNEKRRKHFLDAKNRQAFTFQKGRCYQGDFYNPYLDFGSFSLKLPGFTLKVIKYVGDKTHCLRYVFKNSKTGDLYFNVNFKLLWGDQLQAFLAENKNKDANNAESVRNKNEGESVDGVKSEVGGQHEPGRHSIEANNNNTISDNGEATAFTAPPTMQLHPGDQAAAADASADGKASSSAVDEIDRLLQQTSTSEKRSGPLLDEVD